MVKKQPKPTNTLRDGLVIASVYVALAAFIEMMPRLSIGSPFWPSAGIALGGLLARGRACCWGIWLGASLSGWFVSKVSFPLGIISGLIPMLGAWTASTLVLRFNQSGDFLGYVRKALAFIVVNTCTGTLLQSILGALNILADGKISAEKYWIESLNWWVGDTIGILVFTPLVVAWWEPNSPKLSLSRQQWQEAFLVSVSIMIVCFFSFVESQPLEYLLIPPILWPAFRLGNKVTTLFVAIVSSIAAIFTLYQRGIFFKVSQESDSIIFLQLFMGIISITTTVTLALIAENDRALKNQQQAFEELDRLNRSLEEIVNERTQELQIANQSISQLNEQLTSENLRMSSELAVTRRLQEMILPKTDELHAIKDIEIAGFMQPADEVGGDYYDVLTEGGKLKIGIGDVTGHGLESGVIMIMVQTAIRTLLLSGETSSLKLLSGVNKVVFSNLARMKCDKSLSLSILDYRDNTLHITGQHESVIIIRSNGDIEMIDTMDLGFPIGLLDRVDDFISEQSLSVNDGDLITLYTDGITEAENQNGEFYGIDRFIYILQKYRALPVNEIRQRVIDDIISFVGNAKIYDDITLLILKPKQSLLANFI